MGARARLLPPTHPPTQPPPPTPARSGPGVWISKDASLRASIDNLWDNIAKKIFAYLSNSFTINLLSKVGIAIGFFNMSNSYCINTTATTKVYFRTDGHI